LQCILLGLTLRLTPAVSSISPPLYLILQTPLKDSLLYIPFLSNSLLYISSSIHQKSVLGTYFAPDFFTYVFVIPSNIMYMFYFYLIHYLKHKKWIEERRENLYIYRTFAWSSKI